MMIQCRPVQNDFLNTHGDAAISLLSPEVFREIYGDVYRPIEHSHLLAEKFRVSVLVSVCRFKSRGASTFL
jgi:hypothetical protein